MGAEKVLSLIMKKLKDYRTNHDKATPEGKAKQENLMKLLRIYSSLRKKEKDKVKSSDPKKCENGAQNASHNLNDLVEGEDNHLTEFVAIRSEKQFEIHLENAATSEDNFDNYHENISEIEEVQPSAHDDSESNTLKSDHSNEVNKRETRMPNTKCDIQNNDISVDNDDDVAKMTNNKIMMTDKYYDKVDSIEFEAFVENFDQTINENETETRNSAKGLVQEQFATVDGFLMRLGEGLKRLPYKQRAKLEIEYLRRLYEVQDKVGIFDN